jgi:hypothetical protein
LRFAFRSLRLLKQLQLVASHAGVASTAQGAGSQHFLAALLHLMRSNNPASALLAPVTIIPATKIIMAAAQIIAFFITNPLSKKKHVPEIVGLTKSNSELQNFVQTYIGQFS